MNKVEFKKDGLYLNDEKFFFITFAYLNYKKT